MTSHRAGTIRVIDSHTGGEPTRTVVDGAPDLGSGPLAQRLEVLKSTHDHFRAGIVGEPRGSDVMVGAIIVPPHEPDCIAGVIFFNNVGYLGMCGHGAIGVVATLAHLGRIEPGAHRLDTPVGVVDVVLHPDGQVSVVNVTSWREQAGVTVNVPGIGVVTGDVAYGGNWFFLVANHGQSLQLEQVESLTDYCWLLRQAINQQGYPLVDHIELFVEADGADSRNFVQCPGKAYDRSPCGTGTSAKLACLAADGALAEGAEWVQESIIGSRFRATYRWVDQTAGRIQPTITGRAFVNADSSVLIDEQDPYRWGIR